MNKLVKAAVALVFFFTMTAPLSAGEVTGPFSSSVDSKGNISLPTDFRSTWVHLGSWAVTSTSAAGIGFKQTSPGAGFHDVYTRTESLKLFKKTGAWPDGATIVMEVRAIIWDDLPTGHVMTGGDPVQWFVMVKDARGRFPGNPNWGGGWGWALFKPQDPKKNISTNHNDDCLGCHETVKASDWIFVQGYPALR